MRLIRECEEAIQREYPKNDIKTPCHLAIGAEAIAVGVTHVFADSKVFGTYRNHHWYLAKGGDLDAFWQELYGRKNPIADGKAGSMHLNCPKEGLILTSAVVASQIAPAVGYAFAMKQMCKDTLTIVSLGDGATEEGVFHECLNLASLWQLKILFVVEDNDLAIHQLRENRQSFSLPRLVAAYNMPFDSRVAYTIEDVIDTLDTTVEFPSVVRFKYHRFLEHVGINEDYNAGYRPEPTAEKRQELDPLHNFVIDDRTRKEIDEQVRKRVESSIEKARTTPFAPKESLLEHVWAS
jgi:TPP-dependent pyruvate/acetoin dehydrogenase alpha subunit